MDDFTKIILIPLDDRPVSYTLPVQIAQLSNRIQVFTPPRETLGDLTRYANIDNILLWLDETLSGNDINFIVCSLDTIAYGGLIPSRRANYKTEEIITRLNKFKAIIEQKYKEHKPELYAFSSVMRISNNNINEEEKEYWDKYGELIFEYSYLSYKSEENNSKSSINRLNELKNLIPADILKDYLDTRARNFSINKYYLDWVKEKFIDYLVYSQDDTAQYGLNVKEAQILQKSILDNNLQEKITVQTGADEIPCDLLARGIINQTQEKILIYPVFSNENGKNIISRYEDKSILNSVKGQINLIGAKVTSSIQEADLILLVHTPNKEQNDHALKIYKNQPDKESIKFCIDIINSANKPLIIADIAYANGSDDSLIQEILQNIDISKLYGYAGWNTTGNTLGSSISMGISRYLATKSGNLNIENFKKLLLVRFVDDWAYQAIVRQKIRATTNKADIALLEELLTPFVIELANKINLSLPKIELSFPWNRTFEVEIKI